MRCHPSFCSTVVEKCVYLPVAGMEGEPWARRGWASPTVTLVLSRAWIGPGLPWGPMLSSMAPLEPGQLCLSLNKFPNSALLLLASCLAPAHRTEGGLACSGCPTYLLPPPAAPIHFPVHFCFQCNVPPQALPPPLPPRLHQPTPYRLNPHGAPTAAMPCGSEL